MKPFNYSKVHGSRRIQHIRDCHISIVRKLKNMSLAIALCCGLTGLSAFAQFQSGVEATFVEATGASIPGAEITLTNQATHVSQKGKEDGGGFLRILQLPVGTYVAEIRVAAFQI